MSSTKGNVVGWIKRLPHVGIHLTIKEGLANLLQPTTREKFVDYSFTQKLHTDIHLAYSEFRNQEEHRILGILTGRTYYPEISFQYKVSRRKTVKVKGVLPQIRHAPSKGAGTKGFYLHLEVSKIGSCRHRRRRRMGFQLSRVRNFPLDCGELILGRFKNMKGG